MDDIRSEAVPAALHQQFCTSCGQRAASGRFCGRCGAPLAPESGAQAATGRGAAEGSGANFGHVPQQPTPEPAVRPDEQPTVALQRPTAPDAPASGVGLTAGRPRPDGHPDHELVDNSLDLGWSQDDATVGAAGPARVGRKVLAGGLAALVAVLATGGVLLGRYVSDGELRTAMSTSTRDYNRVLTALTRATDSAAVQAAAAEAAPVAERLERLHGDLDAGQGPEHEAVRAQLQAENDLLLAVADLRQIDVEPLATWTAAHSDLAESLEAEAASRADLARHRPDDAAQLAATGSLLESMSTAVGPALVADTAAEAERLLKRLHDAALTADLRKVGNDVAAEQGAVADAADALPDGDGKKVLSGYATALASMTDLSKIDAEHTGGWTATRAKLAQTFGQVASAAGTSDGAGVRDALEEALTAMDGVVNKASAAMADWKVKTENAVAAQKTDTENLASYTSFFRSQSKVYEQHRQDLAAFTARVEDPNAGVTYYEGYAFLSQAAQDRRDVRDMMVGMDVPAGVRDAHEQVVAAIDRAIGAVQSAYDGLEQSEDCYFEDCLYYRDTPGWQTFQSESDAIGEAYADAMKVWEADAAAAKASVSSRTLPAKPEV